MPTIRFIDPTDTEVIAPFEAGDTLLKAAYFARVEGILAECGGGCSCATCHVHLDDAWDGTVAPPTAMEADMLAFAVEPSAHSRLACQVELTDQHDGLTVTVAKRQY